MSIQRSRRSPSLKARRIISARTTIRKRSTPLRRNLSARRQGKFSDPKSKQRQRRSRNAPNRVRGRAGNGNPRSRRTTSGLRPRVGHVLLGKPRRASDLFGRSRKHFFRSVPDGDQRTLGERAQGFLGAARKLRHPAGRRRRRDIARRANAGGSPWGVADRGAEPRGRVG